MVGEPKAVFRKFSEIVVSKDYPAMGNLRFLGASIASDPTE